MAEKHQGDVMESIKLTFQQRQAFEHANNIIKEN